MPTLNLTNAKKKKRIRLMQKSVEDETKLSENLIMINETRAFEKSKSKSLKYEYFVVVLYDVRIKLHNATFSNLILSEIKVKNDKEGDILGINDEVYLYFTYISCFYHPLLFY
jgi:hypothetical protein